MLSKYATVKKSYDTMKMAQEMLESGFVFDKSVPCIALLQPACACEEWRFSAANGREPWWSQGCETQYTGGRRNHGWHVDLIYVSLSILIHVT